MTIFTPTITCAICGRQRGLDKIRFTLGVGVTISPASSKSECADTILCKMDNAVSPTYTACRIYLVRGIQKELCNGKYPMYFCRLKKKSIFISDHTTIFQCF